MDRNHRVRSNEGSKPARAVVALAATAVLLLSGCAATKGPVASQMKVEQAIALLLDGLYKAQEDQRQQGRTTGVLIGEATVQLSFTVSETDKSSLVLALGAAPAALSFTPFDRSSQTQTANVITLKFVNALTATAKDNLLEQIVKPTAGESPAQAAQRIRKLLDELRDKAPGVFFRLQ